jgi:hypothetical protein
MANYDRQLIRMQASEMEANMQNTSLHEQDLFSAPGRSGLESSSWLDLLILGATSVAVEFN